MVTLIKKAAMSWAGVILAIGWIWVFSQGAVFAKVHGYMLPVVSVLTVDSVVAIDLEGQAAVKLSGSALKIRECDFNGLTWSISGRKTTGTVRAYFRDAPQGREEGVQYWSAIIVGVTEDRLSMTRAEVHHTCNGLPVNSLFFEGAK